MPPSDGVTGGGCKPVPSTPLDHLNLQLWFCIPHSQREAHSRSLALLLHCLCRGSMKVLKAFVSTPLSTVCVHWAASHTLHFPLGLPLTLLLPHSLPPHSLWDLSLGASCRGVSWPHEQQRKIHAHAQLHLLCCPPIQIPAVCVHWDVQCTVQSPASAHISPSITLRSESLFPASTGLLWALPANQESRD